MSDTIDVPVYLQVEPSFYGWDSARQREFLRSAAMVRATQSRPSKPVPGALTVKLILRIERDAFFPLAPSAVIEIPASLTDPNPIVVHADDPTDGEPR
jgi:hypothetical protein